MMLHKKSLYLFLLICFSLTAFGSFAAEDEPPRNTLVASIELENVLDNSWSNLEFSDNPQPPGLYYIELTELIVTIGCWGSKQDPYPDGENGELLMAWKDGEPWFDGTADFKLQYQPDKGVWTELIVIAAQGAIGDAWFPFGLQEAEESIGQTFIVLEEFIGVGLSTPTWNAGNSGCTMTLYSAAEEGDAVEPADKLAVQWGAIKNQRTIAEIASEYGVH